MSVSAYDGTVIATDRASWKGNYIWTPTIKLFKIAPPSEDCCKRFRLSPNHTRLIWAACGYAADVPLILSWMEDGGPIPARRSLGGAGSWGAAGIDYLQLEDQGDHLGNGTI